VDFDIVFKFDVFYSFKSLVSSSMPFSSWDGYYIWI
jgi:hypothetical protein